jgi:2-polyprenyl-3-methyl-5-hydroxy-6-metoxy-1,4-benzoquinol methylase
MKSRIVEPEILDHLPHDDPAAERSRRDLRRINFLMGNERWILQTLGHFSDAAASRICEIGAGEGVLAAKIRRRFVDSRVTACDLAPRPAGLDPAIDWRSGDIFRQAPPAGGVLVANLFLHHFEGDDLRRLGQICEGFDVLILNEPNRTRSAALLGTLLHPVVNHVTRHDMQASIRAGFQRGEMAELLGLDKLHWEIRETSPGLGARRVVAWRASSCDPQLVGDGRLF